MAEFEKRRHACATCTQPRLAKEAGRNSEKEEEVPKRACGERNVMLKKDRNCLLARARTSARPQKCTVLACQQIDGQGRGTGVDDVPSQGRTGRWKGKSQPPMTQERRRGRFLNSERPPPRVGGGRQVTWSNGTARTKRPAASRCPLLKGAWLILLLGYLLFSLSLSLKHPSRCPALVGTPYLCHPWV